MTSQIRALFGGPARFLVRFLVGASAGCFLLILIFAITECCGHASFDRPDDLSCLTWGGLVPALTALLAAIFGGVSIRGKAASTINATLGGMAAGFLIGFVVGALFEPADVWIAFGIYLGTPSGVAVGGIIGVLKSFRAKRDRLRIPPPAAPQ